MLQPLINQAQLLNRVLVEGGNPDEARIEGEFATRLEQELIALYNRPLANGIPTERGEELLERLYAEYADTSEITAVLVEYYLQAFNLGGSDALADLGLGGTFELTDEALLEEVEEWPRMLGDIDGDISIVRTTANELARKIDGLPVAEAAVLLGILADFILARASYRSTLISTEETVRASRDGSRVASAGNGIQEVEFNVQPGPREPDECDQFDGKRYPINAVPVAATIPIHIGCNCYYMPVTDDWQPPENAWTGNEQA